MEWTAPQTIGPPVCSLAAEGKRRARRFLVEVPVRYRERGERAWRAGKTENISRSGVLLRSDHIASPNTPIEISLSLPAQGFDLGAAEVVCQGTVVRVMPPEGLDRLGFLASTISHFRFLRP
jgi:hypothetical protein